MQMGFYFDQTRCTGCYTCCVACKDWHDIPAGPAWWRKINGMEEGDFPNLFVAYLSLACNHCAEPICKTVCPASAITKREADGVMVVDKEKCRTEAPCGIITNETQPHGEVKAPCQVTCPIGLSIPGYIALIAQGKHKEALELIRRRMPLPAICGRVCHHPCETECRRKEVDEPLAIASLRRFVTDYASDGRPAPIPRTKKEKVAIIGSGPAGLAAAYDLVRKGYGVTIFEALPVAGGMLAVGIPEYRLPKEVLKREIEYIKGLGVEIKTNTPFGNGLTLDDLSRQGYGATFIAVGAHRSSRLNIPGSKLKGTMVGLSFLQDINLGKKVELGTRVLVLGGGSVAFDCARSAIRLGASKVHLACVESRKEMPAQTSEIEQSKAEGIVIHPSVSFTNILGKGGKVCGVECLKLRSATFDKAGRLHVDAIEGSEHILEADTIIFAVGQQPDLDSVSAIKGVGVSRRGTIIADPETMQTDHPGVFAGGDAVSGPAHVIDAIAAGQKAAIFIEHYLRGEVVRARPSNGVKAADIKVEIPPETKKAQRQPMPSIAVKQRKAGFNEVALGFSEEMAIAEAKRCLNCAGHLCKDVCPYDVPQFRAEVNAKMEMCNFCSDRLEQDKKPICVAACPLRALDSGPLEELKAKYGDVESSAGFAHSATTQPSIIFKAKKLW